MDINGRIIKFPKFVRKENTNRKRMFECNLKNSIISKHTSAEVDEIDCHYIAEDSIKQAKRSSYFVGENSITSYSATE